MRALLRGTADQIGGVTYDGNGFNQYYGCGRVNAASAVAAAREPQLSGYRQNFNAPANNATGFNDGSSYYASKQRSNAVGPICGWTSWVNVANQTADAGTPANVGVSALSTAGGAGAVGFSDAGDGAGLRAIADDWDSGAGTKAWLIPVNTANYEWLSLSCRMTGTNAPVAFTGPRDFKLQYSLDGNTWIDVSGGELVAGNGLGTFNALTNVALPAECHDQAALPLRLLMTSNTSVTGGTVNGGQCHLDDILITGEAKNNPAASVQAGALRLHGKATDWTGRYTATTYALPTLGAGVTQGFEASFRYRLDTSEVPPADGFSFNYGALRGWVNVGVVGFGRGLNVQFATTIGGEGHVVPAADKQSKVKE